MSNILAHFEIPYVQILNQHGSLVAPLPETLDNPEILVTLYRNMLLARTFDKKAIALQRTGKMGTYAPISGQEAIATAIGHAMQAEDVLIPYYRDYAAQIQRGVKMSEIFSYWGGDERGSNYACGSEDLPICVPIASQCLHAAGVAFAFKYRQQARVAVVCVGDGGTSEGDFYEAMNVAGVWKLPMVCIINNNQWAISVNIKQQTACTTIAQKAIAAGFAGIMVDGNDVIALRTTIGQAIAQARTGGGPTLIEALSYRLSDHTTADDANRYQPPAEVSEAQTKDPLLRMTKYLQQRHILTAELAASIQHDCTQQVQQAVEEYLSKPPQSVDSIFDYHYATLPNYLLAQKESAAQGGLHE